MTSFLGLANFEGERFPSKLIFGEATQVFHGGLIYLYLRYKIQGIMWILLLQHFLSTISSFLCIFMLMEGLCLG